MEYKLYTDIFDEHIITDIKLIQGDDLRISTKNLDVCKKQIYREYQNFHDLYQHQIFNKDSDCVLLDRHKIAACICGAFLKVSIFNKDNLINSIKKTREPVESYFYYVNEFISLIAASKYLSFFMVKDREKKQDYQGAVHVMQYFPIMPPVSNTKVGFWHTTLFNLSQIKIFKPMDSTCYSIGIDHFDMYSYAMFFFWLEYYYNEMTKSSTIS